MAIDVRDNNFTGSSPCKECKHREINQNRCINRCERLAAYRAGEPWEKKEAIEIMEDGTASTEKPVKICIIPDCTKPVKARELCETDYDRWRKGLIEHPVLGTAFKLKHAARKPKKAKKSQPKKPPLGLMPKSIHDQKRAVDILETMKRYADKNKPIPTEWIDELMYLYGEAVAGNREIYDKEKP